MKYLILSITLLLTACSSDEALKAVNTVASYKSLEKQQAEVEALYGKYNNLLDDSEKLLVTQSYSEIKKVRNSNLTDSVINYKIAKASYLQVMPPLFQKYKSKINPVDRAKIALIHSKLKIISESIEDGISKAENKDKNIARYINTALNLVVAFKS